MKSLTPTRHPYPTRCAPPRSRATVVNKQKLSSTYFSASRQAITQSTPGAPRSIGSEWGSFTGDDIVVSCCGCGSATGGLHLHVQYWQPWEPIMDHGIAETRRKQQPVALYLCRRPPPVPAGGRGHVHSDPERIAAHLDATLAVHTVDDRLQLQPERQLQRGHRN